MDCISKMHQDSVSLHITLSYNMLFPFWGENVCIISFEDLKCFHSMSIIYEN